MLAGAAAGAVPGLLFHDDEWAGGYSSFRRRMLRLGHISFFGIGILNVLFAVTLAQVALPDLNVHIASAGFVVAVIAMPLCCFLAAWIKPLFLLAALYDGLLGLVFLITPTEIFAMYGVEPPDHLAFVQVSAFLLIIFAVMFWRVAMDPIGNRELILYGCALKSSYCLLVLVYWLTTGISSMWIPWAWADLVFLVLFALSWQKLGREAGALT